MGFSLFFWRNKPKTQPNVHEPLPPGAAEASAESSSSASTSDASPSAATPTMPFVRDETKPTHPRLQRMAELLQTLPQPPGTIGKPAQPPPLAPPTTQIPAAPQYPSTQPLLATPEYRVQHEYLPVAPLPVHELDAHELLQASVHSELNIMPPIAQSPAPHVDVREQTPTHMHASRLLRPSIHTQPPEHAIVPTHSVHDERSGLEALTGNKEHENTQPPKPPAPIQTTRPSLMPNFAMRASNAFYARSGAVFWTLDELHAALEHMSDETFSHHVSEGRNDFANWIEGCFSGDERVFGSMIHGLDRHAMKHLFNRYAQAPAHTPASIASIPSSVPHSVSISVSSSPHLQENASVPSFLAADEPAFTNAPSSQPAFLATAAQPHFDEKGPALVDIHPALQRSGDAPVQGVLDALNAAELEASKDIGSARESFIAVRTRVWNELTDAQREHVLPRVREVYEKLRSRA
jgi:hypothetical protein